MITSAFEVEFRKDGRVHDPAQVKSLLDGLGGLTDLVVLSHGWNNDRAEAQLLYDTLLKSLAEVAAADLVAGVKDKRLGVMRVLWPSKKFADRDLIPGGGAAGVGGQQASDEALLRLLDEMKKDPDRLGGQEVDEARRAALDRAKALVPQLDSPAAQREFVESLRGILDRTEAHAEDGSAEFFSTAPESLFQNLAQPVPLPAGAGGGGAAGLGDGGAAGFAGDLLAGIKAGARRIANFGTYYQMKTRAGEVGGKGVGAVLAQVRQRRAELPLHLVGHSFGGRLVTAAASTLPANSPQVTLTLLQAAFSHNGFAQKFDQEHDGAFRTVLADRRVSGPIVITHTKNDRAVGIAYPLASRFARDAAAALGDENDPYGGIGRNGALRTPEAEGLAGALRELGEPYALRRGAVFNLRADRFITGHNDVTGHQVAYAILNAVAVTG
jgi:pimeloyl-ACP methyl ester carboxylesterase